MRVIGGAREDREREGRFLRIEDWDVKVWSERWYKDTCIYTCISLGVFVLRYCMLEIEHARAASESSEAKGANSLA